jgi:ubiquinone/menaquinone biosynthesis C-methylase UbiE
MISMVKLNIGCGKKRIEGYVNIDVSDKFRPDVIADMCRLPYKDGTIDEIYTSHTLEHVRDFRKGMKEMHRVLKQGGTLTIVVPYPASLTTYHPHHIWYFSWNSMNPWIKGSEADDYETFHFRAQRQRIILAYGWVDRVFGNFVNRHPGLYEHSFLYSLLPASEIRYELTK